jgi:hypothetical protein
VRDKKCIQNFDRKNLKGRDHPENVGVDGRIIFKRILELQGEKVWTEYIWLRIGTNGSLL